MVRIAIDAMGGDLGVKAMVKGAVDSLQAEGIELLLFGDEAAIKKELSAYAYNPERIAIYPCTESISIHDAPVMAIRRMKDSSLVRGMQAVKEGDADAFVSAGSTGAVLAGGQLIVGREKGVYRPPLAALDAKPEWLTQFAKMGAIYMEEMLGIPNPSIGLVNIGAEEEKGNSLVKATMQLLKEEKDYRFIGSVEARDIVEGNCSVVVCDAFVGNVVLKMYEGVGKMLMGEISDTLKNSGIPTLLGAALIKTALKKRMKKFDAKQYGGAPILGLKGLVVKVHGNTDGREVTTAILQAKDFSEKGLTEKIAKAIDFKGEEV